MKDSVINEVSELTFEVKTSKEVDIQFDFKVPTEGEHITLSLSFNSESLTDKSQSPLHPR